MQNIFDKKAFFNLETIYKNQLALSEKCIEYAAK